MSVNVSMGDVPSWIEATATVIAAGSVVYAARSYRRNVRLGREAQARLVAVWVQGEVWLADDPMRLIVANASALPIHAVRMAARPVVGSIQPISVMCPQVGPNGHWGVTINEPWHVPVECEVHFTDADGIRWHRGFDRILCEVGAEEGMSTAILPSSSS